MRVPECMRRFGGAHPVGETQNQPFQLSFNACLKVDFQGSRVTSDGGLILIRELDERLGLEKLFEKQLSDTGQGLNRQFALADLLRQSVYSRLAGYEDLDDAERTDMFPPLRTAKHGLDHTVHHRVACHDTRRR